MIKLFERTSIKAMSLTNRFVRSATWEGLADKDGFVTPKLIEMVVELAKLYLTVLSKQDGMIYCNDL